MDGRKKGFVWAAALALAALLVFDVPSRLEADEAVVQTGLPTAERMLIPGGQAVGVALKTQGVLVVAKADRGGQKTPLRVGDVILRAQGKPVDGTRTLTQIIAQMQTDSVELEIERGRKRMTVEASVFSDQMDGRRALGVWVRDSTAGVGTLSYIDPLSGAYGALGHAIVDGDTGSMLTAQDGAIMNASVIGVMKGESGRAGELRGSFLKENEQIGTLEDNSAYGIYGHMDARPGSAAMSKALPVGGRQEAHPGPATIIATVDAQGPKAYSIEIVRCFEQNEPNQKGMILRVTDSDLIEKTGGIVQGMSGSPIIQDGKIIGAVTHVYLNDASQGYGMYIEWMLRRSDALSAPDAQAA